VLDRLRGRTVLYVHLAEEALHTGTGTPTGTCMGMGMGAGMVPSAGPVARVEGLGPVSREQLTEWLGTDTVIIRPVIDPTDMVAADCYETPEDLAEALTLRHPYEVFPFGTLLSRVADKDHTRPYLDPDRGGPPGQTGLHNLGPLGRRHHRAKTLGGFACHQPLPGLYLWRIPSGYWYRVDHTGTHPLGRDRPEILDHLLPVTIASKTSAASRVPRSRVETCFGQQLDLVLAT
jgi:hypothetical protein